MVNSEDPHSAASDIGLHNLLNLVCPNTSGKFSKPTQECQEKMLKWTHSAIMQSEKG